MKAAGEADVRTRDLVVMMGGSQPLHPGSTPGVCTSIEWNLVWMADWPTPVDEVGLDRLQNWGHTGMGIPLPCLLVRTGFWTGVRSRSQCADAFLEAGRT